MKKKYLAVALLCIVCAAAGGCAQQQQKEYYPPKVVITETEYKTHEVTLGTVIRQLDDNAVFGIKNIDGEYKHVAVYSGLQKQYLKKGDRVRVHLNGTVYTATLVKQSGENYGDPLDESDAWFVLDQSWPGLNVAINSTVRLEGKFEEKSDIIVLPRTYIGKGSDGGYFVKILVKNADGVEIKTRVPVTVGIQTESGVEITGGISVGDTVVID